jgi:hypothetical protein
MTLEATGRICIKLTNLAVSSEGWKVCRVALESLVMAHFCLEYFGKPIYIYKINNAFSYI